MFQHCCSKMDQYLKEDELCFKYIPRTRDYCIFVKKEYGGSLCGIDYCPWCGNKLRYSLRNELGEILFDELHLDSFFDDPKMPEEFKTDEWWKKRNL